MKPSASQLFSRYSGFSQSLLFLTVAIFLVAFGVRLLTWNDTRLEVGKVQTTVAENYKYFAQLIRQEGMRGFFDSSSELANTTHLGHPPGYSFFIAATRSVFGDSDTSVQIAQIVIDALCAVIIFLIVTELFSPWAALPAGLIAAFSPQFAWNSVLLLPDTLAIFPILMAVYLLVLTRKHPRLILYLAVGALVGISCWLRANAMLMAIFFAAAALLLPADNRSDTGAPSVITRKMRVSQRWRYALAVVAGTILIVAPLTIRNAIVFRRFIPVSLGAGQTLLEGIADYDTAGRFNIPSTDLGIVKQEAEVFNRPDYLKALLDPDGIQRERWRLRRGLGVIGSHPFWFSSVMVRRAASMTRLERSRLVSTEPSISHSLDVISTLQPVGARVPTDLISSGQLYRDVSAAPVPDDDKIVLRGNAEDYGEQFSSAPVPVKQNHDYVFTVPIKVEHGRVKISVKDPSGKTYSSTIAETVEGKAPEEQPLNTVQLPFVAVSDTNTRIVLSNEASPRPLARIGTMNLYELGPARLLWMRYPRLLLHGIQKLILTATILPLAILGLAIVIKQRRWSALIVLSVVPTYYFCVQSAFHTEYRYVLAINYFQFALAAAAIYWIGNLVIRKVSHLSKRREA